MNIGSLSGLAAGLTLALATAGAASADHHRGHGHKSAKSVEITKYEYKYAKPGYGHGHGKGHAKGYGAGYDAGYGPGPKLNCGRIYFIDHVRGRRALVSATQCTGPRGRSVIDHETKTLVRYLPPYRGWWRHGYGYRH